jgi:transcriptional regulator with XRE-family HTH domain
MRSRVRRASAPRKKKNAGRATPVAAAAAETKAHGKRVTGSRGPRLVRRDVPPAVVALSRALRDARVRSGLSAVDAAERVGVHFVTVYAWENVDRADHPSGERLTRVAEVYGTSPKALHRRADVIARELGAAGAGGDAPAKVVRRENTLRQTPADPRRTTVSKQNAATTATAAQRTAEAKARAAPASRCPAALTPTRSASWPPLPRNCRSRRRRSAPRSGRSRHRAFSTCSRRSAPDHCWKTTS